MRVLRFLAVLASLLFVAFALPALAQDTATGLVITDPTGGLIGNVPGGLQVYAILVALASLVSVFVKDGALPPLVAKVLNALALNVKNASNDPAKNTPKKG